VFHFLCTIILWCDHLHSVAVLIPYRSIDNFVSGSVFTCERSRKILSVRVSAILRDSCQTALPGWSTSRTKSRHPTFLFERL